MYRLLFLVTVLCGCGAVGPSSVDVTLSFGASVAPEARGTVTAFAVHATGDETFDDLVALHHAAASEERFVYRPGAQTRELELAVRALDAGGGVVGAGAGTIALSGRGTSSLEIVLERPGAQLDGGVDAAAADLAGADLAPSACGPQQTCINFEGGADDASGQLDVSEGPSCAVVTGVAHGGTHSGHCTGSMASYLALDGSYGATQPLAMRAWLRVSASGTPMSANFVGYYSPSSYVLAGTSFAGDYAANFVSDTKDEIDSTQTAADSSWHCVEVVLGPPGNITFYLDGALAGMQTGATFPAAFSSFVLGIVRAGDMASGTVSDDVYVDDVVLGPSRVGCD